MPDTSAPNFTLPAALTVATVSALREEVLCSLAESGEGADFRVDASAVDSVDAAGLQWLVALERECTARQANLSLLALSPTLDDALGQLGLDASLAA